MPSKKKTKNTFHSYDRASERCGLSKAEAKRLFSAASRSRNSIEKLNPGPLKDYLIRKANAGKRIKILEGYVFVFCSTSTRCLTMYPIDPNVIKAQELFEKGYKYQWCPDCKKYFSYLESEQEPGFRFSEDLACPNCHRIFKTSMEFEYEIEKL